MDAYARNQASRQAASDNSAGAGASDVRGGSIASQPTVLHGASSILIDVSEPTLNLHWEIEQVRGLGLTCMFIAERNDLAALSSAGETADSSELRAQTLSLLASERVLAYDGSTRDGGAAFAPSLKALLAEVAAAKRPSATKAPMVTRVVRFIRRALLWLGLAMVAAYSGAVIGEGLVIWQMHRNFPTLVRDYYPHPCGSALLANDFVVDSMLFVRYLDVCRREELQKFRQYLEIQQEIEDSKPH
jgi:hypothetical protein